MSEKIIKRATHEEEINVEEIAQSGESAKRAGYAHEDVLARPEAYHPEKLTPMRLPGIAVEEKMEGLMHSAATRALDAVAAAVARRTAASRTPAAATRRVECAVADLEAPHRRAGHAEEAPQASRPDESVSRPHDGSERRRRRRAKITTAVRVRALHLTPEGPHEVTSTLDVSRDGILFTTRLDAYRCNMRVMVVFPYSDLLGAIHTEIPGRVVRVACDGEGRYAVAVWLQPPPTADEVVDSAGRRIAAVLPNGAIKIEPPQAPLAVLVEGDARTREALRQVLATECYDVAAFAGGAEARALVERRRPALVVAEVEGTDSPGYELCKRIKASEELKGVPIVVTTSSAYPSNYSSARSLGAVVCMAKPFRAERLVNVARLLAPVPDSVKAAKRVAAPSGKPTGAGKSEANCSNGTNGANRAHEMRPSSAAKSKKGRKVSARRRVAQHLQNLHARFQQLLSSMRGADSPAGAALPQEDSAPDKQPPPASAATQPESENSPRPLIPFPFSS